MLGLFLHLCGPHLMDCMQLVAKVSKETYDISKRDLRY
jgi:hypothetical protein